MNRAQRRSMRPDQIVNPVPNTPVPKAASAEFYQGNVPPPAMMKDFGSLDPSFPERLFKMAEDSGNRQMKQLENQELQIRLDADNRQKEIEASKEIKIADIKGRNRDNFFKNTIAFIGVVAAIGICFALLYFSYVLLKADNTGAALAMASPLIGGALVACIRILRK